MSKKNHARIEHGLLANDRIVLELPDGRTIKLRFRPDAVRRSSRVMIHAPHDVGVRFEGEQLAREIGEAIERERRAIPPPIWGPGAASLGLGPKGGRDAQG